MLSLTLSLSLSLSLSILLIDLRACQASNDFVQYFWKNDIMQFYPPSGHWFWHFDPDSSSWRECISLTCLQRSSSSSSSSSRPWPIAPILKINSTLNSIRGFMVLRSVGNLPYYRKRGSASCCAWGTFGERERDTDRERERRKWRHHCRAKIGDEFTLSLCQKFAQLAMSLHFPLPKTRTFRFSLHTSRLSPHGEVPNCGAEIRNEFTLSLAKNVFALFVPTISNGARRATSERKLQTSDQIPVLYCSSHRKNESN